MTINIFNWGEQKMKVCPKCGREYGNSSVRCVICKCDLEEIVERKSLETKSTKGNTARTTVQNRTLKRDIPNRNTVEDPRKEEQKEMAVYVKNEPEKSEGVSGLGITALVFSLLGCMAFIGAILAIVDLCIKDGKKKVCSILALVFCGIWILVLAIGNLALKDNRRDSSRSVEASTEQEYNSEAEGHDEVKSEESSNFEQEPYNSDFAEENREIENQPLPATEPEEQETYYNGTEFDYEDTHVKYLKHEVVENMAGDKCLAVYYEFTNNSDENKTFLYTFSDKAFQNGVELDVSLFHVNDDSKNSSREIQPGVTVTVVSGFVLSDETSNVTLQVEPMISFTNEKLLEIDLSL